MNRNGSSLVKVVHTINQLRLFNSEISVTGRGRDKFVNLGDATTFRAVGVTGVSAKNLVWHKKRSKKKKKPIKKTNKKTCKVHCANPILIIA